MGFGSVLNLGGDSHGYNVSENPDETAICNDWLMISQDIADVLKGGRVESGTPSTSDNEREHAA